VSEAVASIIEVVDDEKGSVSYTADVAQTATGQNVIVVNANNVAAEEKKVTFNVKPAMLEELGENKADQVVLGWDDVQVWVEPDKLDTSDTNQISVTLEKTETKVESIPALPKDTKVVSTAYKVQATGVDKDELLPITFKAAANVRIMIITPEGEVIFPEMQIVQVYGENALWAEIPNGSLVMLVENN